MKVAFFSGRPFGIAGTPGTYLLVAKLLKHLEAIVFAPDGENDIVFSNGDLPVFPIKRISGKKKYSEIMPALEHFDPDIIYIFNSSEWYELIDFLKKAFSSKKFVLDIKAPLTRQGPLLHQIQKGGADKQNQLDAIVSLSEESVKTWIPDCVLHPIIYPLGVDLSLFHPTDPLLARQHCHRFVYIGSLHPKRQINVLVDFFKDFVRNSSQQVHLDIYGSGPEEEHLREMIASHSLGGCVRLRGLWPQENLLRELPNYDAGIAWVPYENYDHSPSLKALEYMGSGLPILASDTRAHQALIEQGFTIDFFSNSRDSFCTALNHIVESGFSAERIKQNREVIKNFDYEAIIERYFLPLFNELAGSSNALALSPSVPASQHDGPGDKNGQIEGLALGKTRSSHHQNGALKLFIFCNSMAGGKGGAERVAMEMANAMSERGHLIYMAYENTGRPAYPSAKNVVLMPYFSLTALREKILAIDPDVFFAFYFDRGLIKWYSLVHGSGIPFGIQECTNPERLCKNNWTRHGTIEPEFGYWEREILASAATRIRLTMPDYASSFPEYVRPSIRAFPNPASPQQTVADPAGKAAERKIIINVGGMKKHKNLMTLLHAFARVAPTFPDWDIKVFGKCPDGAYEREISGFVQDNGLMGRVKICGPVEDIFSEFATAHIHVIPSLSEGCPTCVLEAMAMGLPSIGFADCPGTNQLIRHEKNGLLASHEDRVTGLENALRQLMGSADIRVSMGRQALEDSGAFDPNHIYDQWETLFLDAAEYKKDPGRLMREQMAIDPERAMHVHRNRRKLLDNRGMRGMI
jgi:glycosyltransferase involved in cell wall biosynthesis